MDEMQAITTLINTNAQLAVVETGEQERVVEWLRAQYNKTGKASYLWTTQRGLQRIATEHVPIPQTMRPADVLEHILTSHHFGIYLLCDFQSALKDSGVCDKLSRLIADDNKTRKLVLLLGENYKLPASLAKRIEHIALI